MPRKANREYNKELALVHQFLKKLYQEYQEDNKLKTEKERLQYAHAVQTTGTIAYHTDINRRETPQTIKAEFYNTIYDS